MEARKLIQDNDIVKFFNCRLVRNHAIIKEDLWIRNGKILDPQKLFFDGKLSADVQINCKDSIITSGFIDLQINGNCFTFMFIQSATPASVYIFFLIGNRRDITLTVESQTYKALHWILKL